MSPSFATILVPIDGSFRSEHALAYAAALSQAGSKVTLLRVDVPDASPVALEAVIAAQTGAVPIDDERQSDELKAIAARWAPAFKGSVTSRVSFGDPKTQILGVAGEIGADLLVCATHGRGVIGRWAFGSVADDLSRAASMPVLVVRAGDDEIAPAAASIARIVFPYDGSELANTARPLAAALAAELGLPIHVVSAYDPGPAGPFSTGMDVTYPMAAYTDMQAELEDLAKESVAQAQTAFHAGGATVTTAVHMGPPSVVIEDAVIDGDLIVMTSHGRGGIRRAVLGSVAEKLIRDGKAPILLVPVAAAEPAAGA